MNFQDFIEVAIIINDKFKIIPMLYGSVGVNKRLGTNIDVNNIDILLYEKYVTVYWEKLYDLMNSIGFTLTDLTTHTFKRNDVVISFSSIESLKGFAGIAISKIPRLNCIIDYYILDVEDYRKVYLASLSDTDRADDKKEKDRLILNLLEKELRRRTIKSVKLKVENSFSAKYPLTDYSHLVRVSNTATEIAKTLGCSEYVSALSGLLYTNSSDVDTILKKEFVTSYEIDLIKSAIDDSQNTKAKTKEGKCLRDAILLENIGAVGVARAFIKCALENLPMYKIEFRRLDIKNELDTSAKSTLDYFYQLQHNRKNMFSTDYARLLAEKRFDFIQDFLYQFYDECDGTL